MLDKEGRFLYSNKAHCDLLKVGMNDIIGKTYGDLSLPDELTARLHLQIQQVVETKSPIRDEMEWTNSNGTLTYYEYRFSPIVNKKDQLEFVAGAARDITDRKQNEMALQEADRRKDVFLATLAHEIRNPLAPILSGLELIRRSKDDPETSERALTVIERQTHNIVRLVDDLLEISRITQGKINLRKERFNLNTAFAMVVESCQNEISTNKLQLITFLPEEPIYIEADALRIEQVLLNLLTNAAKFTPSGGKIWLSARKTNSEAVISVRDNGLGLAPDLIASIFQMFNQVETTSRQASKGLGIGLGVVKQLVEMHGGSVSASSKGEGKGSKFTIRFPLATPIETPTRPPQQEIKMIEEIGSPKQKILIVDDNVDVAKMIQLLLSREGHEVRTAADGESGIEAAADFQPDTCLCDIGLPNMDGYELAGHLRAILPNVRLVAFTGWGQDTDLLRSKDAGFDDHVVKGANMEALSQAIAG